MPKQSIADELESTPPRACRILDYTTTPEPEWIPGLSPFQVHSKTRCFAWPTVKFRLVVTRRTACPFRDVTVSRRHCVIELRDGQVEITDLESHNGTFVNGIPVSKRTLQHGDVVRVGPK